MMFEKAHALATPRKLADSLNKSLVHTGYHVRILRDCEAVRLVKVERVQGADQHFYRCSLKSDWVRTALEATTD
jgi:hypothetical protein